MGARTEWICVPGTLENYISICKKYDKHCVLELKSDFTGEALRRMVDIIRGYNYLDNTTFISFNYKNLTGIRDYSGNQFNFCFRNVQKEIVDRLIADRIDADVYFKALSKGGAASEQKVNCWTVDQREDRTGLFECPAVLLFAPCTEVHPLTMAQKMPKSDRWRRVSPCQFRVCVFKLYSKSRDLEIFLVSIFYFAFGPYCF